MTKKSQVSSFFEGSCLNCDKSDNKKCKVKERGMNIIEREGRHRKLCFDIPLERE